VTPNRQKPWVKGGDLNLRSYLKITDADHRRFDDLYRRYRQLYEQPDRCRPMILVRTPVNGLPAWTQRLADPLVMLRAELDMLRPHLEMQDDHVLTVRVQFGTAQIAAAFGCPLHFPEDSLPAAGGRILTSAEGVYRLAEPDINAGWYAKLEAWTELWKTHLPEGVHIQHPDIQSPFNSAHLIRGNDILMDFYDNPKALEALLDKVTDFMVKRTLRTASLIGAEKDWFFDWGVLWKGTARISNCSMQMISPDLYSKHVLPRDIRFFDSIGGGRMHYCGITEEVISEFFKVPPITGLDVDCRRHDFFALCERAPRRVILMPTGAFGADSPEVKRLLSGDWPSKRNIVVSVEAPSIREGKRLLDRLRNSIPY